MKKWIGLTALLLMAGCTGKDGKDGAPGKPFISTTVNIDGPVMSNLFYVDVPDFNLNRGDIILVYVCKNTLCTQLNMIQASTNSMFYTVQDSRVEIHNAEGGGMTLWYITAVLRR